MYVLTVSTNIALNALLALIFISTVSTNKIPYSIHNSIALIFCMCRAIKQGMVIVNTWVFILRRYKWHIHAGSWSLVNCLAGSLDEALYRVLMNINECGCRPYGWLGLDGNRCIRVIPRHPPFSIKKRLCLHAKKLLLEIYDGP